MLTTLLPGIREFRVPLAAGYLWLMTLAVALEPFVPERSEASGLVASLYRIGEAFSVVGVGVALSFVAYLLGSLSVGLFSSTLRRLFGRDVLPVDRAWNAFTGPTADAIALLATEARSWLDHLLALADTGVSTFIEENLQRRRLKRGPALRRRSRDGSDARVLSSAAPPFRPEEADLDRLRAAIVDDLEIVLTTRLLGRDAELYSAVDRHRSEVEFRLGLIPPLVFGAAAIAGTLPAWPSIAAVATGGLVAVGLHWDALNQERKANAMLVDALADRRVSAPSLERLEAKAKELVEASRSQLMESALRTGASALRRAIETAKRLDSQPSSAFVAMHAAEAAQKHLRAAGSAFPPDVVEPAESALDALRRGTALYVDATEGVENAAGWAEEARRLVEGAEAALLAFQEAGRKEIERVRSEEDPLEARRGGVSPRGRG
ncbi:MAG TPA: hypothetical protein VHI71_01745 [Actinomycetota bacterium]|nr:hypothetical protein [Actinomycetota bacterium]